MRNIRLILLLFSILSCLFPVSVYGDMTVKKIPTIGQMSEKGVKSVFQDSEGYIWYATINGLYRDDGYHVRIFHPSDANNINHITEDSVGRIWISTDKGAYAIDKTNFTSFPLDEQRIASLKVAQIFVTADGDLWVVQYGKLRRYSKNLEWKNDYPITDRSGHVTYVSGFCQSRSGEIFMTSYSRGVYRYNADSDAFEMYRPINEDVPLGAIMQDRRRDYFWMYDFRGHLYRFDPDSKTPFVSSLSRPHDMGGSYHENLYAMSQDDSNGYIWGVSRNHLLIFRPEADGTLTPMNLPILKKFSGMMMSSLLSTPGAMWVGRLDGDSFVVYLNNNMVTEDNLSTLRSRHNMPPVIDKVISAGTHGLYWMLQRRIGLILYDLSTNRISYHDETPGFDRYRLRMGEEMIESPKNHGVWVSQERSLGIFAISHRDMRMFCADSVIIDHLVDHSTRITSLLEDSRGRVWIGTSNGLYAYDLYSRDFVGNYPDLGYVSGLVESADNRIYALSKEMGLYETAGDRLSPVFFSESGLKKGSSIAQAPNGSIWIGTDEGSVFEYVPHNNEFINHSNAEYGRQNGIRQIQFSNDGHGWILTSSKLIEFNPATKLHYTYGSESDMSLFSFMSMSPNSMNGNGNTIGGVGGMAVISSNPILDNPHFDSKIYLSDVVVNGKSRIFDIDNDRDESDGGKIVIGPDEMNIEIYFSSLDYRYPSKGRFAYKLEGFDSDWRFTEIGDNKAFYNKLPRGKNILHVKYIDEFGRVSSSVTKLVLERKPHFYETYYAFFIYFILLAAVVGVVLYLYQRRLKKKNEEMWSDSEEMMKMRTYLSSPVSLPDEEFQKLDRILLEKATQAVEANLDDPDFNVKTLSDAVNMSRSTFSRKLKDITGKSPLDFIREIKMMHACRLLESKNYSVGQISDMLGFSDRRYFTATFRKEMGMTPRDYQNSKTKPSDNSEGDNFSAKEGVKSNRQKNCANSAPFSKDLDTDNE
ncbi:MAG: helix-turn-helix domain-containing protein [Bacteroides sp.]|nr:helix-turn-helix domain-containing protein [Bacteroides sp.]